ncbi:hypothetical protein [Xanthomonas floridensis]|uniref:Uncharacterized protein n=1 Tax=Xanthomonas floridensis TaxID=1843580 RepID=A0A1A9MB63_9XANT|nr:hypothetical protein [Xanthomonas floridensis]MEA5123224.1 hypothetical protein [Xanthomonas floridensis]MEA5130750.1 hypothetical protein [Xanthomonas floridensis]OAG66867.1 hypothetical protein A7D17_03865 [Xanthomonas floridensis]
MDPRKPLLLGQMARLALIRSLCPSLRLPMLPTNWPTGGVTWHLRAFCTGGDAALGLDTDVAIHAFLHDLWLPLSMPFQQCHRICRTVCIE